MNLAELSIEGTLENEIVVELHRDGYRTSGATPMSSYAGKLVDASPDTIASLIPENVRTDINQWSLENPVRSVLTIQSATDALDIIPWERWLVPLLPTVVVRLGHTAGPTLELNRPLRLLASGWSINRLPGIGLELGALASLQGNQPNDIQVSVLSDATPERFHEVLVSFQPDVLHLILPAVASDELGPRTWLSLDDPDNYTPLNDLLQFSDTPSPALVVINTCDSGGGHNGPPPAQVVSDAWNVPTFGWLGEIEDLAAADFAPYFYTRILEGASIVDAVRSYLTIQSNVWPTQSTRGFMARVEQQHPVVPVLWSPDLSAVVTPLLQKRKSQAVTREPSRIIDESPEERLIQNVEVSASYQKFLNPALLKNGQPVLTRLVFDASESISGVGLTARCDTGSGSSVVRQVLNLKPGPQPFPTDRLVFPVLYDLIDAATGRRQVNFTITCTLENEIVWERTDPILWMGRSEWLDRPETWAYIPAFVDPYADGVLDVIDEADRVLKSLDSPTSAFAGYQGNAKSVLCQVEALFNCLRDKPFELKYINPPPIPVYAPGDNLATGQRVRTPTEVINRCRGTCHDLAVLFASCLEHVGIYPLVVLIHGHTFVGFWTESSGHDNFWTAKETQQGGHARATTIWSVTEAGELISLHKEQKIHFIETTMVTDRNAPFDAAEAKGSERFTRAAMEEEFDVAIDIQASRRKIQPL